jgi:photosystem II stability/assembly factor-like uncharacterized protein
MQLRRNVLLALLIVLFIYFEMHSCSEDTTLIPEPEEKITNTLLAANDIFFLDENTGWVVGRNGTMMSTVDGGLTWNCGKVDELDIRSIHFLDTSDGWLVGIEGKLYRSSDGGVNWQQVQFTGYPTTDDFFRIEFFSNSEGFILGYHGVFVTEDGGLEWQNNWLPIVDARGAWSMSMIDKDTAFLLGSRWNVPDPLIIYKSVDGGKNWSAVPGSYASVLRGIATIAFVDESTGWAGGGVIMRTQDGGQTWEIQLDQATVREFWFFDESSGLAVGKTTILSTSDGGETWVDLSVNDDRIYDLRAVHFVDESTGWIAGRGKEIFIDGREYSRSVVLVTRDSGMTWEIEEFAYDISEIEASVLEERVPYSVEW